MKCDKLNIVTITDNNLTDSGAKAVAESLKKNTTVWVLNLRGWISRKMQKTDD